MSPTMAASAAYKAARRAFEAGDRTTGELQWQKAETLYGQLPDDETGKLAISDERDFAASVRGGDAAAAADSLAGGVLAAKTAATVAAADARDSYLGAYLSGFGEGLQEGAKNLSAALDVLGSFKWPLALALAAVAAVKVLR